MKWLKYKINNSINVGTFDNPNWEDNFAEKMLSYCEANEEIAKREAYNGEYTIEDDGIEEDATPSQLDIIEAQVTYTAMMTDTLLEV